MNKETTILGGIEEKDGKWTGVIKIVAPNGDEEIVYSSAFALNSEMDAQTIVEECMKNIVKKLKEKAGPEDRVTFTRLN